MSDKLAIALAQVNPTLGDLAGNAAMIRRLHAEAAAAGADLVVFPELVICGYPPEDLVLKPSFLDRVEQTVRELAAATADLPTALMVGAPWRVGGRLHNVVCLLEGGAVAAIRIKHHLPNYRVFDEKRVFESGPLPEPLTVRGVRIGVPICEDMWFADVTRALADAGAELFVVPNGSPFDAGKVAERLRQADLRVRETGLPLAYVNQVGGQDELVFDGGSFVMHPDGSVATRLPDWTEALVLTRWERGPAGWRCRTHVEAPPAPVEADLYRAMVLGLRDYVNKNGFPGAVLGLSGGVDSALAAAVAADALGPERVIALMLPSPYTSRESLDDAADCAARLGVRLETVPIAPAMAAYETMLAGLFGAAGASDITAQNIQSRARGLALMAVSNQFGHMLVTTGNKSEMATGYATLYGDMCGGYNPVKDLYKTQLYAVCRWRNANHADGLLGPEGPVIPERILTKAPSAELKPNQKDQDSLPEYADLDDILECLIEHEVGVEEIVRRGHDRATVLRVWQMLDRAEYKRRQAPPGAKLTRRAFGKERRYPITNLFFRNIR